MNDLTILSTGFVLIITCFCYLLYEIFISTKESPLDEDYELWEAASDEVWGIASPWPTEPEIVPKKDWIKNGF